MSYLAMYPDFTPPKIKHIVSVSSGAPSALLALKVIETYGAENVDCIFADTLAEHPDNYRFLYDLMQAGMDVLHITRCKTPNQLQLEQNTVFTNSLAPCTRILKLEPIREFVQFRQAQGYVIRMHIGYTLEDTKPSVDKPQGRITDTLEAWYANGVIAEFLLSNTSKHQVFSELKRRGLQVPESYAKGMPNANCLGKGRGGCVKGGKGYMLKVLIHYPEAYAEAEKTETTIRYRQYKKQRANGVRVADVKLYAQLRENSKHITLKAFRERYERYRATEGLQLKMFVLDADGDLCGAECGVSIPEKWSRAA